MVLISALILCLNTPFGGPNFLEDPVVGYIGQAPIRRAEISDVAKFAKIYSPQKMSEWCWAACVSNIFAYYDHPVKQEDIVKRAFGGVVNLPAMTAKRIAEQLSTSWTDDNGVQFHSKLTSAYDSEAHVYFTSNALLFSAIRNDDPIVIATTHCMVITAIDYAPDGSVVGVGVFDPWPTTGSRILTGRDIVPRERGGNMIFLATIKVDKDD